MKKQYILLFITLISALSHSQNTPKLKVQAKELGLANLDIQVEIIGNVATTTFDMLFYNPTNEVLEGELSFPLGQGHNVSRFALDVNGKLTEAVVVDKELGRIAFEQVVRRGVDPALLEKGTGENYKARIYPIPAKGYKRVLLAYEQELIYSNGNHFYDLPLNFTNSLDQFKLEITVFDQKSKPVFNNNKITGLEFSNWNKNFRTCITKRNFKANNNVLIQIPSDQNTEKILTYEDYFYAYKTLVPQKRLRKKATKIALFWDASLSMKDRNIEKELQVLDNYFKYQDNVTVHFVSFSNTILVDKKFKVENANWKAIKDEIQATIYDGATNYSSISQIKQNVDAKLVFTDGMSSLGESILNTSKPLFIVNSLNKSNHSFLNNLAEISNGAYINLNNTSQEESLEAFKYENYKFLGYETNSADHQLYPKSQFTVTNDFSISGKNFNKGDSLILNFGYGNEITQRIPININTSNISNKQVKRLWAQKKLDNLELHPKENKLKITDLGITYGLVTDYTSLIVLEDVWDYITYKITPPAELLDEYNKILAQMEAPKNKRYETSLAAPEINSLSAPQAPIIIEDEILEVEEIVVEESVGYNSTSNGEFVDALEDTDVAFSTIERAPVYPGCEGNNDELKSCFSEKINTHFNNNFNLDVITKLELSHGIQRVFVIFSVSSQGGINDVRVRSQHEAITKEVERIMKLLPLMKPSEQNGAPVGTHYSLPLMFRLEENGQISQSPIQIEKQPNLKKYSGKLIVKDRIANTEYLAELEETKGLEETYKLYLKQRKNYTKITAYYVDVASYFKNRFNNHAYFLRILSNIAEMDFDDYELLKILGYKLQENNEHNLAVSVFERILELRPEDSQSYRDLALAYETVGKCQKALDLFNSIITGDIYTGTHRRNFEGMALIAKNEIRHLIHNYRNDLDLTAIDNDFLDSDTFDIRVTVDWNHNDTDIDLHIIDPNLEECFYRHPTTQIGGMLSKDMTQGFGPEEYTLKDAIKGDYYIKIKYYGDRYQKIENPTFMKVTMYKNYGTKNESSETQIIRLTQKDDEEVIAKMSI